MTFSNDRDLMLLEPNVFIDVPFAAQQRVSVDDGVVSGATLSSDAADFALAQVDAGGVVLVDDVPLEVVARVDANTLTVSRLRADAADAAIGPGDGTALAVIARTFAPQTALVHDMLLRMIGIEAEDPAAPLAADAILSTEVMRRLEVLATLERIYSAAVALTGDNDAVLHKARAYRQRFKAACHGATVLLDLDGDGHPDARRHLGAARLQRL